MDRSRAKTYEDGHGSCTAIDFLVGQSGWPSSSIHFRKDLRLLVTDTLYHFDVSRILETWKSPQRGMSEHEHGFSPQHDHDVQAICCCLPRIFSLTLFLVLAASHAVTAEAMEGLNPRVKPKILSDHPRRFYGI
jgi:hypothetical protein